MIHKLRKAFKFCTITVLSSALMTIPLFAEQKFTRKPNGKIAFVASTEGVTRLRFTNDRVVEIISKESAFEQRNDEVSGDIYFRLIEGAKAEVERGFIITEKGVTLSYQMSPVKRPASDVVVNIIGDVSGSQEQTNSRSTVGRSTSGTPQLAYGDGYKNTLIAVVRDVIVSDLDRRKKSGSGKKFTINKSGYRIDAFVVSGGKSGSQVNEAKFAKPGVVAIWSEYATLSPNQKGWLLVVRK